MQLMEPMALMNLRKGETCLVLGNGPSLERVEFDRLKANVIVIGMHRTWRQYNPPFHVILRQMLYWNEIEQGRWTPQGIVITRTGYELNRRPLRDVRIVQVPMNPRRHQLPKGFVGALHLGTVAQFCGHFALEVAAYIIGRGTINLIGYDMQNGSGHAFPEPDEHISWDSTRQRQRELIAAAHENMRKTYPDIQVFNLARDSAIRSIPFGDLESLYEKKA